MKKTILLTSIIACSICFTTSAKAVDLDYFSVGGTPVLPNTNTTQVRPAPNRQAAPSPTVPNNIPAPAVPNNMPVPAVPNNIPAPNNNPAPVRTVPNNNTVAPTRVVPNNNTVAPNNNAPAPAPVRTVPNNTATPNNNMNNMQNNTIQNNNIQNDNNRGTLRTIMVNPAVRLSLSGVSGAIKISDPASYKQIDVSVDIDNTKISNAQLVIDIPKNLILGSYSNGEDISSIQNTTNIIQPDGSRTLTFNFLPNTNGTQKLDFLVMLPNGSFGTSADYTITARLDQAGSTTQSMTDTLKLIPMDEDLNK